MGRDLWNEKDEQPKTENAAPVAHEPHMAIALSYDPAGAEAPRVVASGRGFVAERILEMAFANDVKVRTDPDLVRLLSAIEVDSVIPLEAFDAVAEILAYIYRLNAESSSAVAVEP